MMQPRQYAQAVMAGEIEMVAVPEAFRGMVADYVAITGANDRRLADSVLALRTRDQPAALDRIVDEQTRERVRLIVAHRRLEDRR